MIKSGYYNHNHHHNLQQQQQQQQQFNNNNDNYNNDDDYQTMKQQQQQQMNNNDEDIDTLKNPNNNNIISNMNTNNTNNNNNTNTNNTNTNNTNTTNNNNNNSNVIEQLTTHINYLQNITIKEKELEINELKKSLQYSLNQLQIKNNEIRNLEQNQLYQQEQRAIELRTLIQRTTNNNNTNTSNNNNTTTTKTTHRRHHNINPYTTTTYNNNTKGSPCRITTTTPSSSNSSFSSSFNNSIITIIWNFITCNNNNKNSNNINGNRILSNPSLRRRNYYMDGGSNNNNNNNNNHNYCTILNYMKHTIIILLFLFYIYKFTISSYDTTTQYDNYYITQQKQNQNQQQNQQLIVEQQNQQQQQNPLLQIPAPPIIHGKRTNGGGSGGYIGVGGIRGYYDNNNAPIQLSTTAPVEINKPITPWNSKPPIPISLYYNDIINSTITTATTTTDNNNNNNNININIPKYVQYRHYCIHQIRKRHEDILGSILFSSSTSKEQNQNQQQNQQHSDLLIVDPSYHGNVGDHMLTLGELQFVKSFLSKEQKPIISNNNNNNNNNTTTETTTTRQIFDTIPEQCHYVQAGQFFPNCDQVITATTTSNNFNNNNKFAMWHAGGNWGDLWRIAQEIRIPSFQTLLQNNYTIIGMPQSFYYSNKQLQLDDSNLLKTKIALGLGFITSSSSSSTSTTLNTTKTKENNEEEEDEDDDNYDGSSIMEDYNNNGIIANTSILDTPEGKKIAYSKVILTWREKESYILGKKTYPFVRNIIVPDIAFQLGPFSPMKHNDDEYNTMDDNNQNQNVDIIVFLRADHESKYSNLRNNDSIESILSSYTNNKKYTFTIVDWPDRLSIFNSNDYFFTKTSIQLLSLGKIIICDRLHASILSYLIGIPFIYIDQVSGKISKTFNVAFPTTLSSSSLLEENEEKEEEKENTNNENNTNITNTNICSGTHHAELALFTKALTLEEALHKAVDWIEQYNL